MANLIQLKGGFETEDPRLDRLPQFDPRSRNFQVAETLEVVGDRRDAPLVPRTRTWYPSKPTLDQGTEGACVGFSCSHRIAADPWRYPGITNAVARDIYKAAQLVDEWPGQDYSGTSVLAGMKVLQARGYIKSYRWVGAGSGKVMDDIILTLGYVGPVVFGLRWMRSMFRPRPSGLLEVDTSRVSGGHAICAVGVWLGATLSGEGTKKFDGVLFQNSWGEGWGMESPIGTRGFCFMRMEDLETLMEMEGEGAVPELPGPCSVCGHELAA